MCVIVSPPEVNVMLTEARKPELVFPFRLAALALSMWTGRIHYAIIIILIHITINNINVYIYIYIQ